MSSKSVAFFLFILIALVGILPAGDAKAPETAVFQVQNLKDEAVVKKLTQSLATIEGVVSAKADAENSQFLVTFEPAKTNPEALTQALTKIDPQTKLEKVQPADANAAKHDCGKCPSKDKCATDKAKEHHEEAKK
ncbi:MAG TPA: cation transporter [Thermoanaerobaculia bacterium]|nr:cation transporter [Thermoanaerobaculia bacterium]HUM29758.1 cation transporter [Thermoanaerobaculia bacterium]HXK67058.1 cation transporter [Thermoanaerobaculia bacterium]